MAPSKKAKPTQLPAPDPRGSAAAPVDDPDVDVTKIDVTKVEVSRVETTIEEPSDDDDDEDLDDDAAEDDEEPEGVAGKAEQLPAEAAPDQPKGELEHRNGRFYDEDGREFRTDEGVWVLVVVPVEKPAPKEEPPPVVELLGDRTPPMPKSTLLYNPGVACACPAFGVEVELRPRLNDVKDLAVADLLVGEGDSRSGTMSKKGIVRVYGPHHPRAKETKVYIAFADDLYARFISDVPQKRRQTRERSR